MFKKFFYNTSEILININKIEYIQKTLACNTVSIYFGLNDNIIVNGSISEIEKIINEKQSNK